MGKIRNNPQAADNANRRGREACAPTVHVAQKPFRRSCASVTSGPSWFFENPSTGTNPAELLTVAEAAACLNISKTGVRRLQQSRTLPFIKIRGAVRFLASDLAAYVGKQRIGPVD